MGDSYGLLSILSAIVVGILLNLAILQLGVFVSSL